MVSLLYTCPATHRRVPTGIETDAESLRASWSTRLTIHCSQCGKPHEFSVLETFIAGASDDAPDWTMPQTDCVDRSVTSREPKASPRHGQRRPIPRR